jgi:quercetin dioxygenase-like cupin family protein
MEKHARGFVVEPEQGAVWEMEHGRPTTFKLLSEQTGDSIAVFEEEVPVGSGTPVHIHPQSDEVIYILAGDFTVKLGEKLAKGRAGSCVFIPRGTAHAWRNTGTEVGKAIYIFTPAGGAKIFESLRLMQIPITAVDPATFTSYCEQYGYEFISFEW